MRYMQMALTAAILAGAVLPVRAFIFGSNKDKKPEKTTVRTISGKMVGEKAWRSGLFAAAGSLYAESAASMDDPVTVAGCRLMVAAAAYYAGPQPVRVVRGNALSAAQLLLEQHSESPYLPVAAAVCGDIAFRNGDYSSAAGYLVTATRTPEVFPGTVAEGVAYRAALACLYGGKQLQAYTLLAALPADSVIADYHTYWLGEAALRCDSTVTAILLLEDLLKDSPDMLAADDIHWLLGEAYLTYGSFSQAWITYQELAGLKRLGEERNRARLYVAGMYEKQDNVAKAKAKYLQVMQAAPGSDWGRTARTRLQALLSVNDDSLTGRAIYYNGNVLAGMDAYVEALAEFEKYIERYPRSPIIGSARLAAAKALFKTGMFTEAEKRFSAILKKYRRGDVAAGAALYVARCRKDAGNVAGARDAYIIFQKLFPKHRKAAEALWYAAWTYEMGGDYDRAITLYNKTASRYRKNILGVEAVWRIGFCRYKAGEYSKAIVLFRKYGKSRSTERRDKSRFWMARARAADGDSVKSDANLRMAYKNYPRTYYSVRAAFHLDSAGFRQDGPGEFDPGFNPVEILMRTAATVRERRLQPMVVEHAATALQGHKRYRMGLRLLSLGLTAAGRAELMRVERAFKNDTAALLLLYEIYVRYEIYDRAYRTAYRALGRIHKSDIDGFPLDELRLMFPPAYYDEFIVAGSASGSEPAPYLAYAVMHRESSFNPGIVSPAGATGLMQIMPATGREIAAVAGDSAFDPVRLVFPEVSIGLGTRYLADLLQRYDGNMPQVLAAYNAGPDKVDMWLRQTGSRDHDRYVEELDFRETRQYVRKVLRSVRLYRELWDDYCRR